MIKYFILEKYRKYLEKARHQKTVTSPVIADRSIELLHHRYRSMPAMNGGHLLDSSSRRGYDRTQSLDRNEKGSAVGNGSWKSEQLKSIGSGSVGMFMYLKGCSNGCSTFYSVGIFLRMG